MSEASSQSTDEVLARIPSGCSILTSAHQGQSTGMLASWVQQASFQPLMLSVAIKHVRPILELIDGSGAFVLNLLGIDPSEMFKHFGGGFGPGEDAFVGLETRKCEEGVILDGAMGYLACKVASKANAGDHWIYFGEVVKGGFLQLDEPYVHSRKTADKY